MRVFLFIIFIVIVPPIYGQEDCATDLIKKNAITLVDVNDLRCLAKFSENRNTIVYTFGIWCTPCRLHLKNAITLKNKYDVNLLILLIEKESDPLVGKSVEYLKEKDSTITIVLLKDKFGKNRNRKYKNFLKEITPKIFENLNGMSKYLVFNNKGEVIMVTTWKDNRKYDWKDDSNMLKNQVIPLLERKE